MSALFSDIKTKLNTPKQKEPIRGIRFAEVLYADDTLIFGTHTHTINKLLHEIQRESDYYNLEKTTSALIWLSTNDNPVSNFLMAHLSHEKEKQHILELCSRIV